MPPTRPPPFPPPPPNKNKQKRFTDRPASAERKPAQEPVSSFQMN